DHRIHDDHAAGARGHAAPSRYRARLHRRERHRAGADLSCRDLAPGDGAVSPSGPRLADLRERTTGGIGPRRTELRAAGLLPWPSVGGGKGLRPDADRRNERRTDQQEAERCDARRDRGAEEGEPRCDRTDPDGPRDVERERHRPRRHAGRRVLPGAARGEGTRRIARRSARPDRRARHAAHVRYPRRAARQRARAEPRPRRADEGRAVKLFFIAAALLAFPAIAAAQSAPSPSPPASAGAVPAPAASATPSAIGPALFPNDPCPTVTNAVCTIRPNHVEIEGGYQNTTYPGTGNTVAYPQPLIRVGTALAGLDVQVSPPNLLRTSTGGPAIAGTSDSGFGLKYTLGATPKLVYGVQVNYTAPTGTAAFSANAVQSIYAVQAGYTLGPVFSLTAGAQDQILAANGASYGSFVPSLVLGASLPASFSAYAEAAQFTHALGPATPTRTQYIYGVSRDVGQRLQLDLEAGFSPTSATGRYHYVGFGFGYYF